MSPNPIISAKLEFLSTAITGTLAAYLKGEIGDDQALEAVSEALEAFSAPIAPETHANAGSAPTAA